MTLNANLLNESKRVDAVGVLADKLRRNGRRHADVIRWVQSVYEDAGRPIPSEAEIDGWLYEADRPKEGGESLR